MANIAIDEASAWRSRPDHVVWIGLHEPDKALLASVQRQFDLHDQPVSPERERFGTNLRATASARLSQLSNAIFWDS